jgi:hypothetical protein
MIVKKNRKISNNKKEAPPNTVNKGKLLVTVFAKSFVLPRQISSESQTRIRALLAIKFLQP